MNLVPINKIQGYGSYDDYYISDEGDIWSLKRKDTLIKLKEGRVKTNKAAWIYDRYGERRCVMIARLVALAFIPNLTNAKRVRFRTEDRMNCSVENLSWKTEMVRKRLGVSKDKDVLLINDDLIEDFKKLYGAVKLKGYSVPTSTEFLNQFLKEAMENYINARGLRKILYQMENG